MEFLKEQQSDFATYLFEYYEEEMLPLVLAVQETPQKKEVIQGLADEIDDRIDHVQDRIYELYDPAIDGR